ncbi:MAG: Fe-S cluster assembly protein SufB, partial [Atopobiaceae bacterium]|nr:Fe-S cluster assembly protein SufB [Atopobiaceae bacterium]
MAEATDNTRKKSQVADVDRSIYDFKMSEEGYERYADGLSGDIVRAISEKKDEPAWMLEMRLKALAVYDEMEMPANWGPSIEMLDLNHISAYVSPKTKQADSWDDVPEDIKNTFERLGIPEAERESLAGVGAQYDSEIVYHNMRAEVADQGVIYTTIEDALHDPELEPIVHEYFGTLIPMRDHKFAALHYAVWSGGSFVYVPEGITRP